MRRTGLRMLMIGLVLLASTAAQAGPTEVDGTPIADTVYRGWQANWRKYAQFSCVAAETYAFIPNYDRRLQSSRLLSESQAERELTVEWEDRNGNLVVKRSRKPPREEAELYARVLPEMSVGAYGYLDSVEIVRIIDDRQMIVKDAWLVDRDEMRELYDQAKADMERRNGEVDRDHLNWLFEKRIEMKEQQEDRDAGFAGPFRLVGYDTRGLRTGERWQGLNNAGFQVGVIKWELPAEDEEQESGRSRRSRRDSEARLVLCELESAMRTPLDEEGFKRMLAERGMTVAEFVDMIRTMRDRDRENAEERIMNALLPPADAPDEEE